MNRARECFSCTLYSTVDKVPSTFSSGSITVCEGKVHKRISNVYKNRRDYQESRPFKSLFSLLDPLFDSTTLVFNQVTVEY